jgi:uncharacterized membrane protein YhaH (DUF805 family)
MERIEKYFRFKGTISGTNYFLRNLLSSALGFFMGYMVGYGLSIENMGLIVLGLTLLAPTIWFSFASLYKRMNALLGKDGTAATIALVSLQMINQFIGEGMFKGIFTLVFFIIGIFLIFSNSNIENHEG